MHPCSTQAMCTCSSSRTLSAKIQQHNNSSTAVVLQQCSHMETPPKTCPLAHWRIDSNDIPAQSPSQECMQWLFSQAQQTHLPGCCCWVYHQQAPAINTRLVAWTASHATAAPMSPSFILHAQQQSTARHSTAWHSVAHLGTTNKSS
jgi:hypothetical protein